MKGLDGDLGADGAPVSVVHRGMDAAPNPAQGTLVRGVVVGGPLQVEGHRGTILEDEVLVHLHRLRAEPAREVGRAGEEREHLGSGAGVRGVAAEVAGEGWRDEGGALVGPPVLSQNPSDTRLVEKRNFHVVRPAPGPQLDFADVYAVCTSKRIPGPYYLHVARNQWKSRRMVVVECRIGTLAFLGHVADGRHRAGAVVVALHAPRGDGGVVHGPTEREVGFHTVFQRIEQGALAAPAVFEQRMGHDIVDDGEPVTGRGF